MTEYQYITLRERAEIKENAAEWFHSKWGVPKEAYLECMDAYLSGKTEYGWYLCMDGDRIVGGRGVIENDWLWRQPWTAYIAPCVLLYAGAITIVNSYRRDPDQWLQRPLPIGEEGKRICCSVHYGGDEYIFRGEQFHGARLDAFCGGIRLDLREAVITEDEEIDIHTFCGGIELYVPAHVKVLV